MAQILIPTYPTFRYVIVDANRRVSARARLLLWAGATLAPHDGIFYVSKPKLTLMIPMHFSW